MLLLCFLVGLVRGGQNSESWEFPPLEKLMAFEKQIPLKTEDCYEVVVSQMDVALFEGLHAKRIVAMTPESAARLAGTNYRCAKGKKPFLVRAVYFNAGTGGFQFYRLEDTLWVTHESLGERGQVHKSAMVVNLDFIPKEAYATASTAR